MNTKFHYSALLTGTIDSSVFLNTGNRIQDVSERLHQYQTSISAYITDSVFDIIVFAENSGYNFNDRPFFELAKRHGKQFEYIKCSSYVEETIHHGKSYGEARLIEEALQKSQLLKNEETIYKLTGRIFLKNSRSICKSFSCHANEFLLYDSKHWCFTNIFKFSKSDYLKYWAEVYMYCDEKSGRDIERVFFDILTKAVSEGLDVGSFAVWPYFDGIQGATLEPYSGNWVERSLRTILCKLGCFSFGSVTSKLLKIR